MGEYQQINLDKISQNIKYVHFLISNEENYEIILEDVELRRSKLDNLGLKRANFKNCRIKQSIIKDCYLREAEFINVDFTGSRFIDCNLERAKFKSCDFRYVTFSGCRINLQEILGSPPSEPNLLRGFLKELRRNEESMGERQKADLILIEEIHAERKSFRQEILPKTSYYKEKATFWSPYVALFKLMKLYLEDVMWGHGLKLTKLMGFGFLLIIIFAALIFLMKPHFKISTSDGLLLELVQALYLSVISFSNIGYGEYIPLTFTGKFLLGFESLLGAIFIGFVAATVYRKIAR